MIYQDIIQISWILILFDKKHMHCRTSLVSEDLPRDDHPHLMDLTPVLHHQDNILDLDSEKSK